MSAQRDHQDNVIRGLKAAINNPNVSEEAKERDRERLQEMGYGGQSGGNVSSGGGSGGRSHEENVARGLKAAINNPNVSEEAKERDRERLREMGEESFDDSGSGGQDSGLSSRVIGGYKATLSNPRTSDAAKAHAEEVLEQNDV